MSLNCLRCKSPLIDARRVQNALVPFWPHSPFYRFFFKDVSTNVLKKSFICRLDSFESTVFMKFKHWIISKDIKVR